MLGCSRSTVSSSLEWLGHPHRANASRKPHEAGGSWGGTPRRSAPLRRPQIHAQGLDLPAEAVTRDVAIVRREFRLAHDQPAGIRADPAPLVVEVPDDLADLRLEFACRGFFRRWATAPLQRVVLTLDHLQSGVDLPAIVIRQVR